MNNLPLSLFIIVFILTLCVITTIKFIISNHKRIKSIIDDLFVIREMLHQSIEIDVYIKLKHNNQTFIYDGLCSLIYYLYKQELIKNNPRVIVKYLLYKFKLKYHNVQCEYGGIPLENTLWFKKGDKKSRVEFLNSVLQNK